MLFTSLNSDINVKRCFAIPRGHAQTESSLTTEPRPITPERKVHGANMGPIWGRQDPGGPYVDPMNFAIWDRQPIAQPVSKIIATRLLWVAL